MENLREVSAQLAAVVEQVGGAAVSVPARRSPASGVVWRDRVVVTNDHALPNVESAQVVLAGGG